MTSQKNSYRAGESIHAHGKTALYLMLCYWKLTPSNERLIVRNG
jgi:hypothetical protein